MVAVSNVVELVDVDGIVLLNRLPPQVTALIDSVSPSLLSSINQQIVSLQNLQNNVDLTDITALQVGLSDETTNRTNADTKLQNNINTVQNNLDAEIANRIAADSTLQTNINTVQSSVTTETTNRTNADAALQVNINTVQSNLNAEATTRATADTNLQSSINTLQNTTASLQTNLSAEVTNRTNADTAMQTSISSLQSGLSTEISNRTTADSNLQAEINTTQANLATETTNRTAADTALQASISTTQTNLSTETTNRTNADAALQTSINNLQTDINTETTDRVASDTNLQNQINTINTTTSTIQTNLSTETTSRTSADTTLQTNIDTIQTNLTTETNDRIAGDASLQSSINNLQTTVNTLASEIKYTPTLGGNLNIYVSSQAVFKITNFDIDQTYSISVSAGSYVLNYDTVTVTAPSSTGTMTLTINTSVYTLNVLPIVVLTPYIVSPVNGTIDMSSSVSITASPFEVTALTDTQLSASWQIATDSAFTNIVQSNISSTVDLDKWEVAGLLVNTIYYVRVQYTGTTYGTSAWSSGVSFTTKAVFFPTNILAAIMPTNLTPYSYFGCSVSISEDGLTVVIGAKGMTVSRKKSQGAIFVYVKNGNAWSEVAMLTASDGAANDLFGSSVYINSTGTALIAGAPGAKIGTSGGQGAAYIFSLASGVWSQTAKIVAADGLPNDGFGTSVSMDYAGTSISIAAINRAVSGVNKAGVVYVYNLSSGNWLQVGEISAPTNTKGNNFGYSQNISPDGNTLIIGAPFKTIGSNVSQGTAYIYTYVNSSWTYVTELNSSDGAANDNFGASVSINNSGTLAVIGAPNKKVGVNTSQGTIYVFGLTSGAWSQTYELSSSDGAAYDKFGTSVAITSDGANIAVGAPNKVVKGKTEEGMVYIFNNNGTTWSQVSELYPPLNSAYMFYGTYVDIDTDISSVIVGATGYNSRSGSAYIGS